MTAEDGERGWH